MHYGGYDHVKRNSYAGKKSREMLAALRTFFPTTMSIQLEI
jgi:hypothetical protein